MIAPKSRSRGKTLCSITQPQRKGPVRSICKRVRKKRDRLEADLRANLHHASAKSASGLAEDATTDIVMRPSACGCQHEVRAVENIECRSFKLEVDLFGDLEVLR